MVDGRLIDRRYGLTYLVLRRKMYKPRALYGWMTAKKRICEIPNKNIQERHLFKWPRDNKRPFRYEVQIDPAFISIIHDGIVKMERAIAKDDSEMNRYGHNSVI